MSFKFKGINLSVIWKLYIEVGFLNILLSTMFPSSEGNFTYNGILIAVVGNLINIYALSILLIGQNHREAGAKSS